LNATAVVVSHWIPSAQAARSANDIGRLIRIDFCFFSGCGFHSRLAPISRSIEAR